MIVYIIYLCLEFPVYVNSTNKKTKSSENVLHSYNNKLFLICVCRLKRNLHLHSTTFHFQFISPSTNIFLLYFALVNQSINKSLGKKNRKRL